MIACKDVLIKMEVSFRIKCPVRSWDWLSSRSSLHTECIKSGTAAFSCWKGYVRSAQGSSDTFTDSPRAVMIREESEPLVTEQIPELQSPASSDVFIHHCFVMASYRKQRCARDHQPWPLWGKWKPHRRMERQLYRQVQRVRCSWWKRSSHFNCQHHPYQSSPTHHLM